MASNEIHLYVVLATNLLLVRRAKRSQRQFRHIHDYDCDDFGVPFPTSEEHCHTRPRRLFEKIRYTTCVRSTPPSFNINTSTIPVDHVLEEKKILCRLRCNVGRCTGGSTRVI